METRRISTILDVNAAPAVAGFKRGEMAAAGFGNAVRRQNAGLASSAAASKNAANSMTGLSRAAASTGGSMKGLSSGMAASATGAAALGTNLRTGVNSMSGLGTAAAATSGSVRSLGSGMQAGAVGASTLATGMKSSSNSMSGLTAASAGAGGAVRTLGGGMKASAAGAATLATGMKSSANSMSGLGAAASGAKSSMSGLGQTAVTTTSLASGGFKNAASAATGFESSVADVGARGGKSLKGLTESIRTNRDEWDSLASKSLIAGAAIVGGLGLMGKAAIDWESSFAGVKKTVDDNAAGYAKLEGELRGLARTLPATHAEIAGVAEAAGQLGIERENVVSFTRTMIDMGESTNLSAEEAATGIARFANVMGTSQTEFSNIGSSMVELGNNFATTEAEILEMAQRLAGAGRQAGMTEGDVLGLSTALSSVGIRAEAGGTAFSRVILEMGKSVDTGSDKLETFAKVAGMSGEAFSKLWQKNSGEAMQRFITGLGQMQARGESLEPTLASLGMTDIRVGDSLRRAASGAKLFTDAMATGNSAYKANSALQDEAAKRYETSASRIKIAWNQIKDAAISFGGSVAPAMARAAEGAASIANAFGRIPGPVKSVITALAGVTGGTLLLGGAAIKAVGFAQNLSGALNTIGMKGGTAAGGLDRANVSAKGIARWGGYALGAAAVVSVLGELADTSVSTPASIDQITKAILDLDSASKGGTDSLDQIFRDLDDGGNLWGNFNVKVDGVTEAFQRLNDPGLMGQFKNFQGGVLPGVTSDTEQLEEAFEGVGEALAAMPAEEAAKKFDLMVKSLGGGKENAKKLLELMPAYADSLTAAGNKAKLAGDDTAAMGGDLEGMGDAAGDAESQVEDLSDAVTSLGDEMLNTRGSARDYQQSLDEVAESIKENGRTLDITSEKGRANEAALDGLAESTQEWAAATIEAGGSAEKAQGILDRGRAKWMDYALSMGMPKKEARELADALFKIPADVTANVKTPGAEKSKKDSKDLKDNLVNLGGTNVAPGVQVKGATEAKSKVLGLGTSIRTLDGKTVKVTESGARTSQVRVRELDGTLVGLPSSKKVKVQEIGSTAAGEMVVQFKDKVFAIPKSKTTQIRENGAGNARAKVLGLNTSIRLLNGKTVKVGEDGAQNATGRVRTMDGAIFGLKGKTVQVQEIGATASGGRVVSFKNRIYEIPQNRSSRVQANVHGLWDVDALRNSISGVQSKTVTITSVTNQIRRKFFEDGGMLEGGEQTFADGGFASIGQQRPQIRPAGGKGITWAEQGAGPWEAFISGHPAKADRSKAIWLETGKRLGMTEAYANGGIRSYRYGQISDRKWDELLARGWRGRPGDNQERIYAPKAKRPTRRSSGGRGSYRYGEISDARWDQLKAQGWKGRAGDNQERIYRPTARAAPKYTGQHTAAYYRKQAQWKRARAQKSAPRAWQHSAGYNRKQAQWDRARAARSKPKATWQHTSEYKQKQAQWARLRAQRAKPKSTWQHSDSYKRKQAEWARIRAAQAAPKSRSGSMQRITPKVTSQRRYVAPSPQSFSRMSGGNVSVDSGAIGSAVATAVGREMRGWQPMVHIGGRDFKGVMQRTNSDRKGR